ncbi:MAG: hypothetical protein ACTH31_08830, partial [Pseudoclavibacter sp.]
MTDAPASNDVSTRAGGNLPGDPLPGRAGGPSRVLIAGAGGMLGRDLQRAFAGRSVTALSRADL